MCFLQLPGVPVTIFWRSVNVAKSPVISHVVGDKADFVNRMVVETVLETEGSYFKLACGIVFLNINSS